MPTLRYVASLAALLGLMSSTLLRAEEQPAAKPAEKPAAEAKADVVELFDGKTLDNWKKTNFGGEGEVRVEKGQIFFDMGDPLTGITWTGKDPLPTDQFEINLEAMRLDGIDFFVGLTFPVRDSHASFICGGWAGGIVGISSINNYDASENETTQFRNFKSDQWYKIRVRVAGGKLQAFIDGENYADVELKDKKISTRSEVDLTKPLGISSFQTKTTYRNIRLTKLAKDAPAEIIKPAAEKPR